MLPNGLVQRRSLVDVNEETDGETSLGHVVSKRNALLKAGLRSFWTVTLMILVAPR